MEGNVEPEETDTPQHQQSLQSVAYLWKGFLSNTSPQTYPNLSAKNVIKVSLGSKHSAFLTDQHAVYCYGSGEFGQLGHKKFSDVTKQPVLVQDLKGENVIDVVCGNNHTAVLCSDGIVFCWGDSSSGQCGIGQVEKTNSPQQVHISDTDSDPVITQIACGESHTVALSSSAEVWAWGTGPQLGLGTGTTPVPKPRKVQGLVGRKVLQIACGSNHSLAVVQKVRSSKSTRQRDLDEEGSGTSSLLMTDEIYSLHEEGDIVIITDTRTVSSSAEEIPSTRSFSPDSIDVAARQAAQKDEAVDSGSEDSNNSQGTYTLDQNKGKGKTSGTDEPVANGDVFHDQTDSTSTPTPATKPERRLTYTESLDSASAKKYLAQQLRPLQLADPPKRTARTSPKERIVASLPQAVASKITKLMSPLSLRSRFSLLDDRSQENALQEDAEVEDLMSIRSQGDLHVGQGSGVKLSLEGCLDDSALQTEVWSWGKGANGQLGQGDPLDKAHPLAIKQLSSKGVVRVLAGPSHSLAIASSGQAYSWGSNSDGQLGHNGQLVPKKLKMPNNALVWDAAAGITHTLLLADGNSFQPDIYYLGKQPSLQELKSEGRTGTPESSPLKDKESSKKRPMSSVAKGPTVKYAARAKQPEKLPFIRKCGWAQYVAAASDLCACIADKNASGYTAILHELAATERLLHYQLTTTRSTIIKALSSSDISKLLEGTIYQKPFRQIVDLFSLLGTAVAHNSIGLTAAVQRSRDLAELVMLKSGPDYRMVFEQYAILVCNFVTIGGFTHMGKIGSDALSKHEAIFMELLNDEKPSSYGSPLRSLMKLPMDRVKSYAYLLAKLKDYFAQASTEFILLKENSEAWSSLQHSIDEKKSNAEETRTFWESCPSKLAEAIKRPDRRLLRDSRTKPLSLFGAGRLSQNWFLLFADIFVHAQFATHQVFPLALIWAEPGQQSEQNTIQLTMPEATLTLQAPSPAEKAEWLWSINQAIDATLTNHKPGFVSPGVVLPSTQKIPPKLTRQGWYVFNGQSRLKDAVYEGVWHLGKPHGKGTLQWPDGKKYTGQFVQGLQHGYGVYTVPSAEKDTKAEVYEGQWQEGSMSGYGTLRYSKGDIYQGDFSDSRRHGHGILHTNKGDLYIGEWQNDHRHGYGIMEERQRGEKYMGKWETDCRHGSGMVITLGGLYYEGVFTQNKLMGVGVLLTEDGTVFEGELTTGPTLSGKGLLTLPSGDFIDGTFSGLWGDGVKVNGTFNKAGDAMPVKKTSPIGKFTVPANMKWEDVFNQTRTVLGWTDKRPESQKAWAGVAVAISSRTQREAERLHRADRITVVEELQKIPSSGHSKGKITEDDYKSIQEYLAKAFDTSLHPLGSLLENLCIAYRETYIGLGAHRWLLPNAVQEIKSYIKRIYQLVRVLFSDLPSEQPNNPQTPVQEHPSSDFHYYYDYSDGHTAPSAVETQRAKSAGRNRQLSMDDITCHITSDGLLYPIVLPRLYPALFTLYALKNEEEDRQYQDKLKRLNERPDMALMAYLSVDQKFWLLEEVMKDSLKRLSEIRDVSYVTAVECLQTLGTTFSPHQKLLIIHTAWEAIKDAIETHCSGKVTLGMDELFPIFQYIVIRARIPHLGSEIQLINDLMDVKSDPGQWGHMFTTLEACYLLTRYDKLPQDCMDFL